MKTYESKMIRNVCLLSHGGAGKTSFIEAVLNNVGVTDRLGKVLDGTTTTDYDPEEIKRKISVNMALAPVEIGGCKINFLDTPGYFDFVGEVIQAIKVSESALIVVGAKDGVAVGTEKSFDFAKENNLAKFVFINKMDEENADFTSVYNKLIEMYGNGVVALQLPIIQGEKFIGYVDVLNMKAKKFEKGKELDIDIPDDLKDSVEEIKEKLNEAIAESSEELMEKYFGGDPFSDEELKEGLSIGIKDGSLIPVFCGSSTENTGLSVVLDCIAKYGPSHVNNNKISLNKEDSDDKIELKISNDEKLTLFVFKTVSDNFVGKINLFKVITGKIKTDSVIYNSSSKKNEKIASLYIMRGKKQIHVSELVTGDIGGVSKLTGTNTNDTLCDQSIKVKMDEIQFPEPAISLAVVPVSKGDEEKIGAGLQKLQDEDQTFKVEINSETHQTLISGVGEQHLDIIVAKLKTRFGTSVKLVDPIVPYRETIKKKIEIEGKHKKQSGGHGQYGHVKIIFEPGENENLTFEEKIFGGSVPRQYFPAVEKGLKESIKKGVLAGYPVVNLKATLIDGSYHSVDSSEMAFKMAASQAFKKGLMAASPVLLEPIASVFVYIPESYMGDIIGDLNKRRGRIMGMNPKEGGIQEVSAEVPMAEMFKYATDLRSMTQGRGKFSMKFERYEEAPPMVSQKVISESKKEEGSE
ncbi:MAG: elongation factor G [Clostridiales bacterium]